MRPSVLNSCQIAKIERSTASSAGTNLTGQFKFTSSRSCASPATLLRRIGPRLRGDDSGESWLHIFGDSVQIISPQVRAERYCTS
jgi:hypothetical protein